MFLYFLSTLQGGEGGSEIRVFWAASPSRIPLFKKLPGDKSPG
jgi:hypothetical protein